MDHNDKERKRTHNFCNSNKLVQIENQMIQKFGVPAEIQHIWVSFISMLMLKILVHKRLVSCARYKGRMH